jgi:hypothetical protein
VARKFRSLRSTFWAIQIEIFPFRYPITSATEKIFNGIDISMVGHQVPFLNLAFACAGQARGIQCPRAAGFAQTTPSCGTSAHEHDMVLALAWYLHLHGACTPMSRGSGD